MKDPYARISLNYYLFLVFLRIFYTDTFYAVNIATLRKLYSQTQFSYNEAI